MVDPETITRLLNEIRTGNKEAESQLIEAVYPQLRRIAGGCIRAMGW